MILWLTLITSAEKLFQTLKNYDWNNWKISIESAVDSMLCQTSMFCSVASTPRRDDENPSSYNKGRPTRSLEGRVPSLSIWPNPWLVRSPIGHYSNDQQIYDIHLMLL